MDASAGTGGGVSNGDRMIDAGSGRTYAAAGVDVESGSRAVDLMKEWVGKTHGPEVIGGLGGFSGLFDASALRSYRRPVLATSTDGVGTKVAIAQRLGVHDTVGFDLVGMVVDDLVVCGAEPLFMTDYIACGKLVPERVASIVQGISQACLTAGCALVGGETAEHPGILSPDEYDVAGAATGAVEAADLLGPERVRDRDVLIAMGSTGLHANGYSLVRHVLFDIAGWTLDRAVPELGRSLGEELLTATRIYTPDCLALTAAVEVHALAHITGGGLADNLARALPPGLTASVDRTTWTPPPIFSLVGRLGDVDQQELEATFNMGVGMIAAVVADDADRAVRLLTERGVTAWIAGDLRTGDGSVQLRGPYGG